MIERPILFSAPMVRAILDGSKTQVRKVAPEFDKPGLDAILQRFPNQRGCPLGEKADRLWVRETWHASLAYELTKASQIPVGSAIAYDSGGGNLPASNAGRKRPSTQMPRWASRISLEITDVRVERVQEISVQDCVAEGMAEVYSGLRGLVPCMEWRYWFEDSWTIQHGPGAWNSNPWVWVVEFKRVLA